MSKRPRLSEVLGKGQEAQGLKERSNQGRPNEDSRSTKLERGEFKQLKAIIPTILHKRVKVAAAENDVEISAIVEEALTSWLENNQRGAI